jgi:hypothetical protein
MIQKCWLVQSCCDPTVIKYILAEGAFLPSLPSRPQIFQDSLGDCYVLMELVEAIPNILEAPFTSTYRSCTACINDNKPCPTAPNKTWLVQSCCNPSITEIVVDNLLLPGNIFQDFNGDCYTVLTATSGIATIVRGENEIIYGSCNRCKPCNSPSPSPTPTSTLSLNVTPTVTSTITVTPSSTVFPLFSRTPSPTPTVTNSPTPTPTTSVGTPVCNCITFANIANETHTGSYINCTSSSISFPISAQTTISVCGSNPSATGDGKVIITIGNACLNGNCVPPDVSPSPTPTPSLSAPTGSIVSPEDLCMDIVFGPAPSLSNTPSATPSITPSATVSLSSNLIFPSLSNTPSLSITPSITPTKTPTISISSTPTPTLTPTPTCNTSCVSCTITYVGPNVIVYPYSLVYLDCCTNVIQQIDYYTSGESYNNIFISRDSLPTSDPNLVITNLVTCFTCSTPTPTPTTSTTPTTTPTPSPTQASGFLVLQACSILYNRTKPRSLYVYNSTTNVSTLLDLDTSFIPFISPDIAHTVDKLWLYNSSVIYEYSLTLNPYTSTFNRSINLPVGVTLGAGLGAIDNTTLISSNTATNQVIQISLLSTNTTNIQSLFALPAGRRIFGDLIYTAFGKIIVTTSTNNAPYNFWISQYNLIGGTWVLEFDLDITTSATSPYGLAVVGNSLYIFSGTNFRQINTSAPYNITQVNNVGVTIAGSSQISSCNLVDFQPNIINNSPSASPSSTPSKTVTPTKTATPSLTPSRTPTPTPSLSPANSNCTGALPLPGGSFIYNGITVTASGTGATTNLCPTALAACTVQSVPNTINLGFPGPLLDYSYTLTFSQPVNNVKLILTTINGIAPNVEFFTFTTDIGIPSVLSTDACFVDIVSNTVTGTRVNGGGTFSISTASPYTVLTVTGRGGGPEQNTPMSIDCNSISPVTSNCAPCSIKSLPVGAKGTAIYNNFIVTASYQGPEIPEFSSTAPSTMTCTGLSIPPPSQTTILGFNPGSFICTLTFSQPVNNIKLLIATGGDSVDPASLETFTFNTSGGTPTLTACGSSCGNIIEDNVLSLGYVLPFGGAILTQINAPSTYTQLIITGNGGLGGSLFALCDDNGMPLSESASPTPTPSLTATPSKTPTRTATPSVTPSKTPSKTATPSITPSKTPSITPSSSPGSLITCNTILYRTTSNTYAAYNFSANTSTLLNVAPNPNPSLDITNNVPVSLAHTNDKLWVYAWDSITNAIVIRENNLNLNSSTATFNRNINLPVLYKPGNALVALNNTTLIGVISEPYVGLNNIIYNEYFLIEYDISGLTAIPTLKFKFPNFRRPAGGLTYIPGINPKIIILSKTDYNPNPVSPPTLSQYFYNTGQLEVTNMSPIGDVQTLLPTTGVGLATINGSLYLMGPNIKLISPIFPYYYTGAQNPGISMAATSQLVNCSTSTLISDRCYGGLPALNIPNTVTYNGITITASGTGQVTQMWDVWYSTCDSSTTGVKIGPGAVYLGARWNVPFNLPTSFVYTLTFSQPVNNLRFLMAAMNGTPGTPFIPEAFVFTSNGGNVTISSPNNCFSNISGNTITANEGGVTTPGGAGTFTISAPTSYTQLTITGNGGLGGTIMGIDCSSLISFPAFSPGSSQSASPSKTPSITVTPSITRTPSITPSKTPTPTRSAPFNPNALKCVYYSRFPNSNLYSYNPITNTSTQISGIPGAGIATNVSPTDAHTTTKYFRGNTTTNSITEYNSTGPNSLALFRTITINSGYSRFFHLQAINDTTLLTLFTNLAIINQQFIFKVATFNITNISVTSAQITPLFDVYSADAGLFNILLTSTNKFLHTASKSISTTSSSKIHVLRQYSYPNGVLELEINLSSVIPNPPQTTIELFESGGVIYLTSCAATGTATQIYRINLTSPYALTLVNTIPFQTKAFNSSINCNTVNLIPPPATSPPASPPASPPSNAFKTIYKYLNIQ